jgi:hypothetical protein
MTNSAWNNGNLVWDDKTDKAIDWMSRVLASKGAFTWNVKRQFYPTKLHEDDIALLKIIYAGLPDSPPSTTSPSSSPSISLSPSAQQDGTPSVSPDGTPSASPSFFPSKSPSFEDQCTESRNDEYVWVDKKGVGRSYKCIFLKDLSIKKRERARRICQKGFGSTSAKNVCPKSCAPFLEEVKEFSLRKKDGSEVKKLCKMLVDLEVDENFERITKICTMTAMGSQTFIPASIQCEITCGRISKKDMEFKFTKKNGTEKTKTCKWLYKLSLRKPYRAERICNDPLVDSTCYFVCNPCVT